MKKIRTRSLAECKTLDQVCLLPRDNFKAGDYWLISDSFVVTVTAQKAGVAPTGQVSVPRREFNRLIAAYLKPQRIRS